MCKHSVSALTAAKQLANILSLPSTKGSVLVWIHNGDQCLMIAADRKWVKFHKDIPQSYLGFPVIIGDPITGTSFH